MHPHIVECIHANIMSTQVKKTMGGFSSISGNYSGVIMFWWRLLQVVLVLLMWPYDAKVAVEGQLSSSFYDNSCPNVSAIVAQVVEEAIAQEARMAASLLRLHFHDCFVQGCDGSILIDDTSGEQVAPPNLKSVRGFEVVDDIKSAVEVVCPGIVSCADILAIAAHVSVTTVGGPSWTVLLGRRDSITFATSTQVINALPSPNEPLPNIIQKFLNVGLSTQDVVVLSGAHTIGRSRCVSFQDRLYNFNGTGSPDPSLDLTYLPTLQTLCPQDGGDGTSTTILEDLDQSTPDNFDINYFANLEINRGLLQSDQALYSTALGATSTTISLVENYTTNQDNFFIDFTDAMVRMGNINPLTGSDGQIRLMCGQVNEVDEGYITHDFLVNVI